MSKFVVSARKYRPSRFDEVVGQEHVSQTLKNALQNEQLAHAFLFCGPRGVGKTTCARILAKLLNCQNVTEDHEACNECSSCRSFNENASFNITELDAASNNSVEHIRALIEQVRFQPQQGKYKIFIIDEVHMLSQQAFNAFLKTLEEPPPYAIFILATTEKHKIIPTILSRCQIFDFRRIQVPAMVKHLQEICVKEGIEADKEALHIIAQKADGALRDALSIFDRIASFSGKKISYEDVITNLNILDYDHFFRFVDGLLMEDVSKILLHFDEILKLGFEPDIFINGLGEHLRNLLVSKDEQTLSLLEVSESLRKRYKEQANNSPISFLLSALNIANDCDINFKMARNKRLHVEMALIKMCYINRAVDLSKQKIQSAPTEKTQEKKTFDPIVSPINKVEEAPPEKIIKEETPKATLDSKTTVVQNKEVDNTDATFEKEEEKPSIEKRNVSNGLLKTSKLGGPKIAKLSDLDQVVESNTSEEEEDVSILTTENLQKVWAEYVEKIQSPSVKTMMKKAELQLEIAEQKIIVVIGSQIAKGMIQQEAGLMSFLRAGLKTKGLLLEVKIDSSKSAANTEIKKPKFLTVKEKYEMLNKANPLLQKIKDQFDLKIDK